MVLHWRVTGTLYRVIYGIFDCGTYWKAILGDAEYARLIDNLKSGEQGIFVLSRGDHSVLTDDFRPQTVQETESVQNEFPVSIRDIDFYHFYEPKFAIDLPNTKIIGPATKSQTGFEVSMPCGLSSV